MSTQSTTEMEREALIQKLMGLRGPWIGDGITSIHRDTIVDAIRSTLPAPGTPAAPQGQAGAWLPMESAPMDGSWMLILDAEGVHKAAWLDDRFDKRQPPSMRWCIACSWQDEQGGHYTIDEPTGWQPLPQPPKDPA